MNYYIPEPCHENWNKMTPKEQGRHCDVCSKVVVDFTKKNTEQINQVLDKAEGNVCGHFNINQLNPQAQNKVFRKPVNLFNQNWKYFAFALFGVFALSKKSDAQTKRGMVKLAGKPMPVKHDENTSTTRIYGTVTTSNGGYASGTSVSIVSGGKKIGETKTIANGSYYIDIAPGKIKSKKADLFFDHHSYGIKEMRDVEITKASNAVNITLGEEIWVLGNVAVLETKDTVVKIIPDTAVIKCTQVEQATDSTVETKEKQQEPVEPILKNEPEPVKDQPEVNNTLNPFVFRPEDIVATIYPNPAGTYATIYCNRNTSYTVELFDVKGVLMLSRNFTGEKLQLDVSVYLRGTYFVKVSDDKGHVNTMKLVKM